jgi:hypothetical protein
LKGGTFTREGSGSTSATTTVLFQNSSGTELFKIKDNGYALMGSTAGTGFEFDNDQSSQYPGMTVYSAIGGNVARLGYLKSYCAMSASSGYFGLGTINPENKLHIYDNSATQNVRLGIYENTYNDYPNSIYHDYRLRYAGGISDVGNSPIARITASGVITGANNSTYKGSYTINLRDNSTLTQILKVSAPGVINLKPITAATATALTPSEGDMLFVNSTDATFTSIGFWGYQNGTWTKM